MTINSDGKTHKNRPVTITKKQVNSACEVLIEEQELTQSQPSIVSVAIYMIVSGKDIPNLADGKTILCSHIENGNFYYLAKRLDQSFVNQKIKDHWDCDSYVASNVVSEENCLDLRHLPESQIIRDKNKSEHKEVIRKKFGDELQGLNFWVY